LSNIFSDIDVWTFNLKGSTNIGAFAAAQIAGFNDQVVKFSGTTTLILHSNRLRRVESIEIRDVEHRSISKTLGQSLLLLLKVLV
jgi:hypothetical protein